jgi:hypothetical protein
MDIVTTAFQWGHIARSQGDNYQAIHHFTKALEVFHSVVGPDCDRTFWAMILFDRAESFLLCQQYHMVETDIKRALSDCPQQLFDLVSFMTFTTIISIVLPKRRNSEVNMKKVQRNHRKGLIMHDWPLLYLKHIKILINIDHIADVF